MYWNQELQYRASGDNTERLFVNNKLYIDDYYNFLKTAENYPSALEFQKTLVTQEAWEAKC